MIPWLLLLQATLTITVPGPPTSAEYLPLRVAEAEGYFAEERLQVTLRAVRAAPIAAEALARGEVDLAATSLDSALRLGHIDGRPPRLVFGLTEAPPLVLLVPSAHRDSVRQIQDLAGTTVGIPSPGTPEHQVLLSLLARARVRPQQATLLSFGERGLAGAIEKGEVSAGVIGDPRATRLLEDGKAVALVDLRKRGEGERWLGARTVHAALFARADTKLGDSELVPLSRALLKAMARIGNAAPQDLAGSLEPAVVGLAEDFAARLSGAREILLYRGEVSPKRLANGVALARARAPLPAGVKLPSSLESLLFIGALKQALGTRVE